MATKFANSSPLVRRLLTTNDREITHELNLQNLSRNVVAITCSKHSLQAIIKRGFNR